MRKSSQQYCGYPIGDCALRAERDALAARLARAEFLLGQVRGCLPLASQKRVDEFLGLPVNGSAVHGDGNG